MISSPTWRRKEFLNSFPGRAHKVPFSGVFWRQGDTGTLLGQLKGIRDGGFPSFQVAARGDFAQGGPRWKGDGDSSENGKWEFSLGIWGYV